MDERTKLVSLLKKLFQSDMADVDTGIYRIINRKRNDIERFIDKDLIDAVDSEFGKYEQKNAGDIKKEIEDLRKQIEEEISPGAIDKQGNLLPQFAGVRRAQQLAEQYRAKQATLKEAMLSVEHKNEVYNHIYQFFSRYYDSGDFMPLRRSSMKKKYSIPYNGEETMFYWANQDQYYIKTGEQFNNYTFKTGNYVIHFRLTTAETSTNNNKEADRYFVLAGGEKDKITFDASKGELNIYFEYRALTDEEKATLSRRSAKEALILNNEQDIIAAIEDFGVRNALIQKVSGEEYSLLYKHLRTYSIANKSDYFIHKNLKEFLECELDFYIKNEMLNIDDLGTDNEIPVERYLARVKVFKAICGKVIEFLAQIEDFQRMLFEKKKFVLSANYCMTLDMVPEKFYEEIIENKAQVDEWSSLGFLDTGGQATLEACMKKGITIDYLKRSQFLVLDTKFFDNKFRDRLLADFKDLDGNTGGLIIKSENWQALRLLENKYAQKVKCIYIDPPYNTGNDGFLYKDNYQESSWLTMLINRIEPSKSLLADDGLFFSSIDDIELSSLTSLLTKLFGKNNFVSNFIVKSNPRGKQSNRYVATTHEYIISYFNNVIGELYKEDLSEKQISEYNQVDESGKRYRLLGLRKRGAASRRVDVPTLFYPIYYNADTKEISIYENPNSIKILPKLETGEDGRWRWKPQKVMDDRHLLEVREVRRPGGKELDVFSKDYLDIGEGLKKTKYVSIWDDKEINYEFAKEMLKDMFGESVFDYPKTEYLIKRVVKISTKDNDIIMDFFAGSGTTAHATLDQNKEDESNRKYILIESEDYFDTVIKPRIEKVMFSFDWKAGHPTSMDGISHMFKYLYLEQYEDTLENIAFLESGSVQKTLYEMDGYFIKYMLDYETRESPCRLNVLKLSDPFNYTLWVRNGGVKVEQKVDLLETFNYLIGMHVHQILSYENDGVYYRVVHGVAENKPVSVVWRSTKGFNDDKLRNDKAFIEGIIMNGRKPEKLYINGDFFVEGAIPVEIGFKRIMGA